MYKNREDPHRNRRVKRDYIRAKKAWRGCVRCGEKDPRCLDLHHKDPKEKLRGKYSNSNMSWMLDLTIAQLAKEFAKCEILCANCHRKEHLSL